MNGASCFLKAVSVLIIILTALSEYPGTTCPGLKLSTPLSSDWPNNADCVERDFEVRLTKLENIISIFIDVMTSRMFECGLYLTGEIYRLASLFFLKMPSNSILTVSPGIYPRVAYAALSNLKSGLVCWKSFVSLSCAG